MAVFDDTTEASELDFVHHNGMSGEMYLPEITGSGIALFDVDNDGDLDLFLVQGHDLGPPKSVEEALFAAQGSSGFKDRLMRNDLHGVDGRRSQRWVDVTDESGLISTGYGMGVAVGDVDNDGFADLYVTNLGPNRLLLNRSEATSGAIRFEDVTERAGVGDPSWSVSATFVDLDRDGWLDLYVGNYLEFTRFDHHKCLSDNGAADYCGPLAFRTQPDRLYRNMGIGTDGVVRFEDIGAGSTVERESGGSLGVTAADFDGDGRMDLYVANDQRPNLLWHNLGQGRLRNDALLAGCSLNAEGRAESSMGVAAEDLDSDGDIDIFLSHLSGETHTLYLNDGGGQFRDETITSNLGAMSWKATGFGTSFFDYDNDGELDLFVVNGAVKAIEELASAGDPFPLHQPNQLFRGIGGGRFTDVSAVAGEALALSEVSRGAAFGDLDNDGDTDVVVSNNNGPTRILTNRIGQDSSWLGLRVVDGLGRDLSGVRVEVEKRDGSRLWRRSRRDGSYASSSDPRMLFGLGDAVAIVAVRAHWPGGGTETWYELEIDRYHTLRRGEGRNEITRNDRP